MSSSIVIHVLRPYANEEEYLAQESFSIDARSMLLIEQAPLPPGTLIVFDVSLANGHKPIRAEGKVVQHVAGDSTQPGGLRVRFKRFGAATKACIDRAVASSPPRSLAPGAAPSVPSLAPEGQRMPSLAPSAAASLPSLAPEARTAPSLVPSAAPSVPVTARATQAWPPPPLWNAKPELEESSGVHRKVPVPVAAPANREALLGRLRARRAS